MTPNVAWSDNQLMATINAAQQNNEAALKALCHKYEGLIHKYAHVSAVQCEANDIESLLWEVFIRAVKEYDINGDVPFSGFVKSRLNTVNTMRLENLENNGSGKHLLWIRLLTVTIKP